MRLGLRHRPILLAAAGLGVLVFCLGWGLGLPVQTALLVGWCAATLSYVGPTLRFMHRATPAQMRRRAELLDEGEGAILAASLAAAIAAHRRRRAGSWPRSQAGWARPRWRWRCSRSRCPGSSCTCCSRCATRMNTGRPTAGWNFPADEEPAFDDFLYFAFTIGMTFQTSDVAVSKRLLRQLALVHALVSFLFNVVILAAAVNVAAGLVG